jgi:hypothetical protein
MRNPVGRESEVAQTLEFVECTNWGTDSITFGAMMLSDGSEHDSIIAWTDPTTHPHCICSSTILAPAGRALILPPAYAALAPADRYTVTPGTLLLTVDDRDLGTTLSETDGVIVYRSDTPHTIIAAAADSMPMYTDAAFSLSAPTPPEGISVIPEYPLSPHRGYTACTDSVSPGRVEDMRGAWLCEWRFDRVSPDRRYVETTVTCARAGNRIAQVRYTLTPLHHTKTIDQGLLYATQHRYYISLSLPLQRGALAFGLHQEAPFADTSLYWRIVPAEAYMPPRSLIVTELYPRAAQGACEWFELHNTTDGPIDCAHWCVQNGEYTDTLTSSRCVIAAHGFLVVSRDRDALSALFPAIAHLVEPPRWHALSNSRDTLIIRDPHGTIQDSLLYDRDHFPQWDHEVLVRIPQHRFATRDGDWIRRDRASPGQPNPAGMQSSPPSVGLHIGPAVFTPNGDTRDDKLCIRCTTTSPHTVQVTVYGFSGRTLRRWKDVIAPRLWWDGRDSRGRAAPCGPFYVVARFIDSGGAVITIRKKGVLWR